MESSVRPRRYAYLLGVLYSHHELAPLCRLQACFRTISAVMLLSRVSSATNRGGLEISYRSWRKYCSSDIPKFEQRFFHTYNVALLIPCYRHTCATAAPASASRVEYAIC